MDEVDDHGETLLNLVAGHPVKGWRVAPLDCEGVPDSLGVGELLPGDVLGLLDPVDLNLAPELLCQNLGH